MSADLRLFRRMRGLFWVAIVLLVGLAAPLIVLASTLAAQFDLTSAETTRSIGGSTAVMEVGLGALLGFSTLVAVVIGATAGSIDQQRGMLRELVLAGRSRLLIPMRRFLAGLIWLTAAALVAAVIVVVIALSLAPVDGSTDWEHVWRSTGSVLPPLASSLLMCFGLALLLGSRGPAIGVYMAFVFIIENLLGNLPGVGDDWREISLNQAIGRMSAVISEPKAPRMESLTHDSVVVAVWCIGVPLLGLWRLHRRDL